MSRKSFDDYAGIAYSIIKLMQPIGMITGAVVSLASAFKVVSRSKADIINDAVMLNNTAAGYLSTKTKPSLMRDTLESDGFEMLTIASAVVWFVCSAATLFIKDDEEPEQENAEDAEDYELDDDELGSDMAWL